MGKLLPGTRLEEGVRRRDIRTNFIFAPKSVQAAAHLFPKLTATYLNRHLPPTHRPCTRTRHSTLLKSPLLPFGKDFGMELMRG